MPEGRIRALFGDALKGEDDLGWRLSYGDDMTSDVYLSRRDDGAVVGITVNRPVVAPELWQAIFDMLGIQNAVFFFPDGGPIVRSEGAGAHLPPEMIEALGPPTLVTSAADLIRVMDAA